MNLKHTLFASGALLAVSLGTTAHAQTASSKPAAPAAGTTIEELVVTAEKREQSLQDVPVAISAFTAKQRDVMGITSIQDYTNFTPGLVYSSATDRASVRGIGRLTNIHAADAAVAIYVDGLFTTSTVLAGAPPLLVDRVEVLRGPQGTLYGRNSIGGAINIISPKPTDHPYAEVRAIAENFGYTNLQVAASGPLAEGLRFRVAGYKLDQTEGYYKNVNRNMPTEGAKRNEYDWQFQLDANLGEHVEAWLKYETLRWDNRGGPGARAGYLGGAYETALMDPAFTVIYNPAHGYSTASGLAGVVPGSLQQFNGGTTTTNPALNDAHTFNTNTPLHVRLTNTHLLSTTLVYHAPKFDVKYLGSHENYDYDLTGDMDNTNVASYQIPLAPGSICGTLHGAFAAGLSPQDCAPLTVNGNNTYYYFEHPTWTSHEINITSTTDSPLQWILGAYYFKEDYAATVPTANLATANSPQLQHPILGAAANPSGNWATNEYSMTTESKALFGQLDWKATETLKFTAGLRYTKDHKYGSEAYRILCYSDACMPSLYTALGLNGFGPGTAANWGSLLGNLNALGSLAPVLGIPALAGLNGLGNGALDITGNLVPVTGPGGIKGVTDPVKCTTPTTCTQGAVDPKTGRFIRHLDDTSDAWTGTLGAQWDPSEGTMAYARYSRGYKAFGFAAGSLLSQPEAKEETVNAFEVGLKKNFGRNLQVNAALFYLDYANLQAPVTVVNNGIAATQFINVPKSRSDGLELDVIWQPIDPLRLSLDYSFNDTEITKSGLYTDVNNTGSGPVSVKGNKLPQAPRNKVALNGTYTFNLDPGNLSLSASYVWRDKAYANIFTRSYNEAPSWDQFDLRAAFTDRDNKYTIIGYVKNVGDTKGYDAAIAASQRISTPTGAPNFELTPPRTYGVELQYRFF
ncbi:TonB-dependent receptor [Phenylobacterium soli]|uniref:TonB-dependent receptor n=1 Tax=Phenylobacterium soli TaxID=2170551 RepID=A0A328AQH5_9CAUL|nr:TonB-dependent receptor [Phenylobacterium soli]RAK55754.1 hypothetical protein DJ017_15165 [Phenylobacterium soli]